MIGQRIAARSRFPWGALLFLLAGLGLVGLALTFSAAGPAIGAVLPLAWSLALWRTRHEPQFAATFQADGIAVEDPPALIPYASLRQVLANYRPPDPARFRKSSGTIQVRHEAGVLHIPPRLSVPSYQVYRFLAGQVPAGGRKVNPARLDDPRLRDTGSRFHRRRNVSPALLDYLERQEREFGPENVWTYCAASNPAEGTGYRGIKAFGTGLVLAGLIWIGLDLAGLIKAGLGGLGLVCTIFGGMFLAGIYVEDQMANRGIKKWKKARLVIGPRGMAMVQGDIRGKVDWPELLEVHYRARRRPFTSTDAGARESILLMMKGAGVVIADIYDRPLPLIHEQILALSGKNAPTDAGAVALLKKEPFS